MKTASSKEAYDRLFYEILPEAVASGCDVAYWPSSPHSPLGYEEGFNKPRCGDTHFWDVWHARKPVSAYLEHSSRFCSEFGMQSYMSKEGATCFAGLGEPLNVFSPVFEAHQKVGFRTEKWFFQEVFQTDELPTVYGYCPYRLGSLTKWLCFRFCGLRAMLFSLFFFLVDVLHT